MKALCPASRQGEPVLDDGHLNAQSVQERVHVPVVLALMQQDVHEDIRGTVQQRLPVNVHLARRQLISVLERVEVLASVTADPAPVGLHFVP